ncbi:MAG: DAK2 domain-containing protein [Clostridiales bacterium]|nr:DAK2 domain-containing protein [Candidatus Coliplasma caballi]
MREETLFDEVVLKHSPVLAVDGEALAGMIRSAANALCKQKDLINQLNVYPVPDGDTGSNMSMTMTPAKELSGRSGSVSDCAEKAAGMFLRAARGNSGVILSLFFRGIAKGLKGKQVATAGDLREAFACGTKEAYKAAQYPREGTILTVMRVSTSEKPETDDILSLFATMHRVAAETLEKTPEMLPVLKQAGVVDTGGRGFLEILGGMLAYLKGEPVEYVPDAEAEEGTAADFASFDTESIENPYCTECIITKRDDCTSADVEKLRRFILDAGDSAVFADDTEIIKIHVHVKDPGKVLSEALLYGSLYTVKVENMRNQHTSLVNKEAEKIASAPQVAAPTEKYGFVAVVMGDGIRDLFRDFGVNTFVEGGQTMNPSTEQLVQAVLSTPAKTVFLFPNNGNICLVANQVAGLVNDRKVCVIPSVSVPQGISALMQFDESASADDNCRNMIAAMSNVKTLDMTYAAHSSTVNGEKVERGQILGLVNHKVRYVADDRLECIDKMLEQMQGASYITVLYGCDVEPVEANEIVTHLQEKLPDAEVAMLSGGQPLYYYIISVE